MGWSGPLTHRQYVSWQVWLAGEWNRPTRSDYYAMQVACEVRRVLSKKPNSIRMDHFNLKFKQVAKRKPLQYTRPVESPERENIQDPYVACEQRDEGQEYLFSDDTTQTTQSKPPIESVRPRPITSSIEAAKKLWFGRLGMKDPRKNQGGDPNQGSGPAGFKP